MTPVPTTLPCKPNILIYSGHGTSRRIVDHTFASIREVAPLYKLVPATEHMLSSPSWHKDTALLVLPGGRDARYLQALDGRPNENIKAFVAGGGGYLGICAGAYYAADHMAFARNQPELRIEGARPLKFFRGLCEGPMTPSFDYNDFKGSVAWPVPQGGVAYYHGGCTFVGAQRDPKVEVLHTYDAAGKYPASVVCQHGAGLAVLTGLHWEFSGLSLSEGYPAAMVSALVGAEAARRAQFSGLVNRSLAGDKACHLPRQMSLLAVDGAEQGSDGAAGCLADEGHVLKIE